MFPTDLDGQVDAVRGFSRFYTRKLGIIEPKLLHSAFTLQEARILYEIAHRPACTATDLARDLGLDAGFLSRTLQTLQRRQIVTRKPSKHDGRVNELSLTAKGRTAQVELERRSREEVGTLLASLDDTERAAIVRAMATIEQTLERPAEKPAAFLLRSHRPGDIGWVISSQAQAWWTAAMASPSCGCCWWRRKRADSASAARWSSNASAARARKATRR